MRKKYTSIFLFLILMLNFLIFTNIVSAESFFRDFDGDGVGGQVTSSWLNTGALSANFHVTNEQSLSGNSFKTSGEGYFNLTYGQDIRVINIDFMFDCEDAGDGIINYYFNTSEDVTIILLEVDYDNANNRIDSVKYFTYGAGWVELISNSPAQHVWTEVKLEITSSTIITYDFSIGNAVGVGATDVNYESIENSISYVYVEKVGNPTYYIDNLFVNTTDTAPLEEGTIYLKLFDLETGEQLYTGGLGTSKNWMLESSKMPNTRVKINSDLLGGVEYDPYEEYGLIITMSDLVFVNGDYHFINLSKMSGYQNPQFDVKGYFDSDNYLQLFNGQTYTIYVSDSVSGYGGYSNCEGGFGSSAGFEFGDPGYRELCTDALWYIQGESVNIRYTAPTSTWLYNNGIPASSYFIWIYDVENLGWLWWDTDGGASADNNPYLSDYAVSLDNQYHYLHWDYDPGETFGYKTVTGGVDHYKMYIGHGGGGLFGLDIHLTSGPEFYITAGDYTPHGNITSISPSEPMLGQFTTIGFEANNNGYLTFKNVLAPDDTEETITNFQKFDGIETVARQFFDFGSYELNLYVSSGLEFEVVDTETFDITDINGSFGDFGFGIEFLTVDPARAIAGYDTVFINYRSLDDTGEISVVDARGQTTSYGTIVGEKRGVLNITLPNHAAIGEWNITLTTANNTLYTSFQIIAEENNFVEFDKNVYFENEQFNLKLKHSKKIELVFYKNDVAVGTDWYLDVGIFPVGIYDVPLEKVTLSPGSWRVEMWEVNNFVKIRMMAQDTCIVIETPAGSLTEGGSGDIFQILTSGAGSIAEGEFGLAFMAIIFILVVIVSLAQLKLKNDTIFFGAILMSMFMVFIGWLPVWIAVLAIVLAGFLFSSAFSKKLGLGS